MGNLVYVASQGGILIVLAKLGSPELVGRFTLALSICSPIFLLTNLKLRDVQAVDAQNKFQFADFLAVRILTTLLALITIGAIVFAVDYPVETASVLLIMGLAKSIESFSDLFYGLLQKHEQMKGIAKSMIIKGVLSLACLAIATYINDSLSYGVSALAAIWLVVLLAYDVPNGIKILANTGKGSTNLASQMLCFAQKKTKQNRATTKLINLTWLALPLGAATALTSLCAYIPYYFIEHYLSEESLGIFAALAYPVIAGNVIVAALAQVSLPRLSKYYALRDRPNFNSLLLKLVGISILLGGAGIAISIFWGNSLLTLLYSDVYAMYSHIFFWLMVAAAINYASWFLNSALTALGIFRRQLLLRTITLMVILVMSLLLVPKYGILGAAWAICINAIVTLILFAIVFINWNRTDRVHNIFPESE